MRRYKILWADDEIDMLKSHILFIQEKGYEVTPVISGQDAVECFCEQTFDIVFIDEHMPGISGLQTLDQLKKINPNIPVIMITKSEDEGIMTDAIGKQIADYLIKPVNPNQILLALKKNLHKEDIVSEAVLAGYRNEFLWINEQINAADDFDDWYNIYKKILDWELNLAESQSPLLESLLAQKEDATHIFGRYIRQNYESWIQGTAQSPLLSHQIFAQKIMPLLGEGEKLFFILIDNFRFDQWLMVKDLISGSFSVNEEYHCSILPTATQYARNAMFAGLLPAEIRNKFPALWIDENDERRKNNFEEELLKTQLTRNGIDCSCSYHKISSPGKNGGAVKEIHSLQNNLLNVVVLNFIDMLSHARTGSEMIKGLSSDEVAYRSLTRSWFQHSGVLEMLKEIGKSGFRIVLTSDHGTIRVKKTQKIVGERDMNTNLRYKVGRNIQYDRKKVYDILKPQNIGLPAPNISSRYIFACGDDFFVYPNDSQHYTQYYTDTFQHGGISLEEMIVPLITMTPK